MASLREITDPEEIAGIFGGAAPARAEPQAAPQAAPQGMREITDPDLIASIFGSPKASFDDRFGNGPMASAADTSTPLGEGVRRKADEMLVGKPSAQNIAAAGVLRTINTAGLNIPRAVGAAIKSLPVVGNGEGYGENYQLSKDREDAFARQAPYASGLGTATGLVGGALALPSLQAAKGAGILGRMGANALTGAGYGAAGELVDSRDLGKAAGAAAIGGAAGAALTPAAELAGRVLGRLTARGVPHVDADGALTDEARQALEAAGIDHQAVPAEVLAAFKAKGPSEAAAREGLAKKYGIDLTEGQASGNYGQQQAESMMARTGRGGEPDEAGDAIRKFYENQYRQVDEAKRDIGRRFAGGEEVVANPNEAADMIANRGAAEASRAGQVEARYNDEAEATLRRLRGDQPIDAIDAGATAQQGVRREAAASRERYQGLYDEASQATGAFDPSAFRNVRQGVIRNLETRENPVYTDDLTTPVAHRALNDLETMPGFSDPEGIGASMQDVERYRKRLVAYAGAADPAKPADRRAMSNILSAFDDHVETAMEAGLFTGSPEALTNFQRARAAFRQHQQAFKPRATGDDAGASMRMIVERDATPEQVSRMLYGQGTVDMSGKAMRITDRLEQVLGADSPEFAAIRQGYIANVLNGADMSHPAIVNRIDAALTGKGRGLAYRLLTDEQIAGLRSFQTAARTAQAVRERVPQWVGDLAKGNYDPQVIASNLWGKTTVGGNKVSADYAQSLKRFFGESAPEWQAARQAVWQKLVEKTEGSTDNYGAQATANRIADFLHGKGRSLANVMFNPDERATIAEFGRLSSYMVPKKVAGGSAAPNSDTAPALASIAQRLQKSEKKIGAIFGGIGFLKGGFVGAGAGFAAGKAVAGLGQKLVDRATLQRAEKAIGGAPVRRIVGTSSLPAAAGPLSAGAGIAAGTN